MEKLVWIVRFAGITACWVFIPAQILISVGHIIGRRLFAFSGTPLQELEWHLFVATIFFCFGLAYLSDRHVRIDILRDRLGAASRARIEVVGFFIAILPFCLVTIYFGTEYAVDSFEMGERSRAALGLPHRWIIKSVIPLGALFLLVAGIVVVSRNIAILRGNSVADNPAEQRQ